MADFTVSTDVDALMQSADNAAIKTQLGILTPEAIMNPVVEGMGLLNAFKGSSAAYSLRDLTGDDPNVVDVRRASDDTTATFKASEMGSVVENWVNATVALPLDTASGASAAYSLRDLAATRSDITSSGDTGGETTGALVAQVRRSSDDEIKSFTAADVAGTALTDWVNTDVVAYTSDFTVDHDGWSTGGVASLFGNQDGVSDGATSKDDALKMVAGSTNTLHRMYKVVVPDNDDGKYRVEIEYYIPSSNVDVDKLRLITSGGDLPDWTVVSGSNTTVGSWATVTFESDVVPASNGVLQIRMGKEGWTTFAGNGTDTVYFASIKSTQIAASGHVVTWYDQSGNANHATQATDASQPKIVDAGTLVADGVKFDGADDYMDSPVTTLSNPFTYFITSTFDNRSGFYPLLDGITDNDARAALGNTLGSVLEGIYAGSHINVSSPIVTDVAVRSAFFIGDATSALYRNGVELVSGDAGSNTPYQGIRIAADNDLSGSSYSAIEVSEIIIYNSDQSDNRIPIESNMADHYGDIDLPAGFDSGNNEVDGFVAQWYDQSGVNHAVQGTTTSQPKIVENGTYLGTVKFDGVDDRMAATLGGGSSINNYLIASVATLPGDEGNQTILSTGLGGYNGNDAWLFKRRTGLNSELSFEAYNSGGLLSPANYTSIESLIVAQGNATNTKLFSNGSEVATGASIPIDAQNITIGDRGDGGLNLNGSISEIIIYDSDQSAARTNIEYNINNAYSIY